MKLQLKKTDVQALSLKPLESDVQIDEGFSYTISFTDDKLNLAFIIFDFSLKTHENFHLQIEFRAIFETETDLTEEDRRSKFFSINAPAIAYPFLRAFVSNFLLQSGMEPVILPSVNFAALEKENQQ